MTSGADGVHDQGYDQNAGTVKKPDGDLYLDWNQDRGEERIRRQGYKKSDDSKKEDNKSSDSSKSDNKGDSSQSSRIPAIRRVPANNNSSSNGGSQKKWVAEQSTGRQITARSGYRM